jgi:hypothetical protein
MRWCRTVFALVVFPRVHAVVTAGSAAMLRFDEEKGAGPDLVDEDSVMRAHILNEGAFQLHDRWRAAMQHEYIKNRSRELKKINARSMRHAAAPDAAGKKLERKLNALSKTHSVVSLVGTDIEVPPRWKSVHGFQRPPGPPRGNDPPVLLGPPGPNQHFWVDRDGTRYRPLLLCDNTNKYDAYILGNLPISRYVNINQHSSMLPSIAHANNWESAASVLDAMELEPLESRTKYADIQHRRWVNSQVPRLPPNDKLRANWPNLPLAIRLQNLAIVNEVRQYSTLSLYFHFSRSHPSHIKLSISPYLSLLL